MAQLIVPPENGPVGIAQGQDILIEPKPDMLLAESVEQHTPNWRQRLTLAVSGEVVAAEVSPANEAFRGAVTLATAGASHSQVATAAAFGMSTLAIEGAAALAATPVLETDSANAGINWARRFMRRFNPNAGGEFPWYAHATAAVMGGSAVNMTFMKYGNPDISREELRGYGIRTALGLTALCGTAGLAGPRLWSL